MFSVENRIGRLVEIRLTAPMTVGEVAELAVACKREMGKALRRQQSKLAVVVTDLRGFALLSPDVFEAMTLMMRSNNVMCERTAQLVERSALGLMQADRAVREAGLSQRRNFNQEAQIIAFLAEVLTPGETSRMTAFLAEFKGRALPDKPG